MARRGLAVQALAARTPIRAILVALLLGGTGGCAQPLYRWSGYDDALRAHLERPDRLSQWEAALRSIISECEASGERVPPGVYAEYAAVLLDQGRIEAAVTYFGRERDAWPESEVLVARMILFADELAGRARPMRPAPAVAPDAFVPSEPIVPESER